MMDLKSKSIVVGALAAAALGASSAGAAPLSPGDRAPVEAAGAPSDVSSSGEDGPRTSAMFRLSGGGSVPEPATWAVLGLGAGALGATIRRRRRRRALTVTYN